MSRCDLSIEKVQGFTSFTNASDKHSALVYFSQPKKRKKLVLVIKPHSFLLVDKLTEIDVESLSYRFVLK